MYGENVRYVYGSLIGLAVERGGAGGLSLKRLFAPNELLESRTLTQLEAFNLKKVFRVLLSF